MKRVLEAIQERRDQKMRQAQQQSVDRTRVIGAQSGYPLDDASDEEVVAATLHARRIAASCGIPIASAAQALRNAVDTNRREKAMP